MKQLDVIDFDVSGLDVTKLNVAVEATLEQTTDPRHRYLLESYIRHRYLETAGRWNEILDPTMTVERPHYRFSLSGQPPFALDGRDEVAALYSHWADTDQCIFYVEDEHVAVGDHLVVSRAIAYQQTLGADMITVDVDIDNDAMYLVRSQVIMLWPYDDQCRLVGEDVWEFDDAKRAIIKLEPADVLSASKAAKLLHPLIRSLRPFDDDLLPA